MKKDKILTIIIIIVGILILGESYNIIRTLNTKPNKIEEIETNNILSNDKSIAIWVQDSEDDEWHEADNRDSWPSPTTHGFVGAECTDSDGKEIDYTNILHFDLSTYHATIDTKNSIYCTLYFAKGRPLLQALEETKGSTLNLTSAVDGMYRYKGTTTAVTNNYICFGTTDKDECLKTPDKYMFRIIGITSADDNTLGLKKDQLKLIKATPSSTSQVWYSNYTSDIKWDSSSTKSHVTSWYNTNIKNKQPNGTYWDSIVTSQKWYNADQTSTPGTVEPKTSQSAANKVALMYATDFNNASTGTSSWLYVKNGWSTSSTLSGNSLNEWTMSRYGYYRGRDGSTYEAWCVETNGGLWWYLIDYAYAVRPVFYLQSAINLTGAGTATDPFRITTKNNA